MTNRRGAFRVAIFFILLTGIGLLTSADYGLPCDEPAEQVILQENLKEYACQLFGADSAAARYYDANGIRRISESIERDHGQAAYYLAAPLLSLEPSAPEWMTTLWHAYTWLWFMVGVLALYRLARELGLSQPGACAASLLLYLSPRFFAEGHYNNKDVVLLALVLWTLAAGARLLREPTVPRAIWFSLAGALATNTKIIGALAWGLMGLVFLGALLLRRQLTLRRCWVGLAAILSFIGFFILMTPAAWVDPLGYLPYVFKNATGFSRWTGVVLFGGFPYAHTRGLPLPHLYLPTMIAFTVPVVFLALAAIGQARALILCVKGDPRRPLLMALTLLWLMPLTYVILKQPLLYNGWRHFYFLYAGIAAMGALGMQAVWEALGQSRARRRVAAVALGLVFAFQAVGIATNHPYQYAYYNLLAGKAEHRYELDYWDVSTVNAMRKLAAQAGNGRDFAPGAGQPG